MFNMGTEKTQEFNEKEPTPLYGVFSLYNLIPGCILFQLPAKTFLPLMGKNKGRPLTKNEEHFKRSTIKENKQRDVKKCQ
jgi:hypothetical protein